MGRKLTPRAVQRRLGLRCVETVWRLIRRGDLPARDRNQGGARPSYEIDEDAFECWAEANWPDYVPRSAAR